MDDLVAFLRARLDEEKAGAKAATDGPWAAWDGPALHGLGDLIHPVLTPGQKPGSRASIVTASWLDAEHIASHDPARVLAEVEAKRQLVEAYAEVAANDVDEPYEYAYGWANGLGLAVRCLASSYASHPDYRAEWAPAA